VSAIPWTRSTVSPRAMSLLSRRPQGPSQRSPEAIGPGGRPPLALPSELMGDEKQDEERTDRDSERSDEAHWQVAEEGAEPEDAPAQKTAKGYEIPIPTRGDFFGNLKKVIRPDK